MSWCCVVLFVVVIGVITWVTRDWFGPTGPPG